MFSGGPGSTPAVLGRVLQEPPLCGLRDLCERDFSSDPGGEREGHQEETARPASEPYPEPREGCNRSVKRGCARLHGAHLCLVDFNFSISNIQSLLQNNPDDMEVVPSRAEIYPLWCFLEGRVPPRPFWAETWILNIGYWIFFRLCEWVA